VNCCDASELRPPGIDVGWIGGHGMMTKRQAWKRDPGERDSAGRWTATDPHWVGARLSWTWDNDTFSRNPQTVGIA
jgi:hypothetical protein